MVCLPISNDPRLAPERDLRLSLDAMADELLRRLQVFVGRSVADVHLAQDLVQDIALAVIEALPRLRHTDRFWPWVYRIAANKVHDHRRRRRHPGGLRLLTELRDDCPDRRGEGVPEVACREEATERLRAAIPRLPDIQRRSLTLKVLEGKGAQETAHLLGCSPSAVNVHVFRARRSLRGLLGSCSEGEERDKNAPARHKRVTSVQYISSGCGRSPLARKSG